MTLTTLVPVVRSCRWILLLVSLLSCSKRVAQNQGMDASAPKDPLALPPGFVADVIALHPDQAWDVLRSSLDATTSAIPSSLALYVGDLLGLPRNASELFYLREFAAGVLLEDEQRIDWVLAIPIMDASQFLQRLESGTHRHFTPTGDGATGPRFLEPSSPLPIAAELAMVDDRLVIGSRREAITRAAAYVARRQILRNVPETHLFVVAPQPALAGPLLKRTKQAWATWKNSRQTGPLGAGEAIHFELVRWAEPLADTDAKMERLFSLMADLAEARLSVTVENGRVRLLLKLAPASRNGSAGTQLASMAVGDAEALLSYPLSAPLVVATRDTPAHRVSEADAQIEKIGRAAGGTLAPADREVVQNALRSWSAGRGDWLTAGLLSSRETRALVARGAVSDRETLHAGALGLVNVLSLPGLSEPIGHWMGDLKISPPSVNRHATLDGDGTLQTVHIIRRARPESPDAKAPPPETIDVVWSIGKETFVGAAGKDAKAALSILGKTNHRRWADDPNVSMLVRRIGHQVEFALLADAARFPTMEPANPPAPVVFACGKDTLDTGVETGWIEADLPYSVLPSFFETLRTSFSQ
jgi:hypothetical protein